LQEIISHPLWVAGNKILLDHRALKIDRIDTTGVAMVSVFYKIIVPKLGNGKMALDMNRDIDFGLVRAWENMKDFDVGIKINVLRSIKEAKYW
jgi:hypothetical protein